MSINYKLYYSLFISIYIVITIIQLCYVSNVFADNTNSKNIIKFLARNKESQDKTTKHILDNERELQENEREHCWAFSLAEFSGWETINEGLQLGRFFGVSNDNNKFEVVIVRIDPRYYNFSLHMASQTGKAFSLPEWSYEYNLDVVINASMYLPNGLTSTGYLRNSEHINNGHIASKFGAFFVADPYNKQLPNANLLDRSVDNWEKIIPQYRVVIQNYRLISADRKLLWRSKKISHSIAAVARDGKGFLLFIHTRCPMSDSDFGNLLLSLPVDLRVAMYVEGGSQAGLFLKTPSYKQIWTGKHPVDILDVEYAIQPIPNVIGVRKK